MIPQKSISKGEMKSTRTSKAKTAMKIRGYERSTISKRELIPYWNILSRKSNDKNQIERKKKKVYSIQPRTFKAPKAIIWSLIETSLLTGRKLK